MITARKTYERTSQEYFANLKKEYGCIPENHREAINLRMNFFKEYVLKRVSI